MSIVHVVERFIKVLATVSLLGCSLVNAAEIRILAPNAVKESVVEIVARFEKETGHKAVLSWAGTESIGSDHYEHGNGSRGTLSELGPGSKYRSGAHNA